MAGLLELTPDVERVQGLSDDAWRSRSGPRSFQSGATTVVAPEEPRIIAFRRLPQRWLKEVQTLLALPDGWDSYGALSPNAVAVAATASLLDWCSSLGISDPSAVPTPQGGIQLEWHEGGKDLELHCRPDGFVDLFGEDQAGGEQAERTVHLGGPLLERWVRKFVLQPA